MNINEIEHALYSDPWQAPELGDSDSLIKLRQELQAIDERLKVSPPPQLKASLLRIPAHSARPGGLGRLMPAGWSWQAMMPLAASLLFALSLSLYYWPVNEEGMRRDIFKHMYSELVMLEVDKNIDLSMLNQHIHAFGAQLQTNPATIQLDVMDLKDCRVAHEHSLHLVLNTPDGPVTVFMMGNRPIEDEYPISDGRFSGIITPMGNGNIAILSDTEHQEGVNRVKSLLSTSMSW